MEVTVTAEAIVGQHEGTGNETSSKFGDEKSRVDALTAQAALAAIETFEIVGDNNDSREPNADDRFILTEFIAHAFGGYPVKQPAAAPSDDAMLQSAHTLEHIAKMVDRVFSADVVRDLCGIAQQIRALAAREAQPAPSLADERAAFEVDILSGPCANVYYTQDNVPRDQRQQVVVIRKSDYDRLTEARAASANETGAEGFSYASKQATACAGCGEHKHTPLRIDWMGGYVCLTCIDRELESRSRATAAQPAVAWMHRDDPRECISDAKKRDIVEHNGIPGRRAAELYSIPFGRLDPAPAMVAEAAAIPAGWKAMPIDAPESLLDVLCDAARGWPTYVDVRPIYDKLIAAAPQPPAQAGALEPCAHDYVRSDSVCTECGSQAGARGTLADDQRSTIERAIALIGPKHPVAEELRALLSTHPTEQPCAGQPNHDGWLQSGGLLYRLTDERHPQNRDEIHVTMVGGSRDDAVRARRAAQLFSLLTGHPEPLADVTAAQETALAVLKELRGRRGFDHLIDGLDEETRDEIVRAIASIVPNARAGDQS
ncbi:hypothetical protein WI37_10980 [Burkholderia ubonensis]|nr:hypothetical protein WI37_10980 [Burkholderia ubonensis]